MLLGSYNVPTMKMALKAIFRLLEICSCQTMDTGKTNMAKSMTTLGTARPTRYGGKLM